MTETQPSAHSNGPAPRKRSTRSPALRRLGRGVMPWLYLMPALIVFTWFKFYPMISGFLMSFYEVKFYDPSVWVGLDNYRAILHDSALLVATWHTIIYVIAETIGAAVLAFFLALALEGPARHVRIIRTAIFVPAITSVAIIAELWRILFNSASYGLVNSFIGLFGIPPQGFLTDPSQALWVLILMSIWKSAPYDMVIFLAGLVSINRELYDAADVDGASRLRKIWHVTLPGIVPAISVVVMLSFIRGFRVFTEVYATTGGGPAGSTSTIMTQIYKVGFEQLNYGYAAAVSFLLLLFTVLMTILHTVLKNRFFG
ncbi:sugar ABC transporter permease [Thioclava dalianensis]|uniref:Sugar ABC transporter permease n=1 Tax=Thioclava dalianensis TaxID=1185766 RepID=A0A074TIZ8_9RHOB|nr:sugar ABC transporter permease [Thioclava dalianensis]KEP68988.1 sugar ABC transporter permease [Thioclava dalianensis]SFN73031.1 multiple sugar transport system permease protein [Thioclava dalianensis]